VSSANFLERPKSSNTVGYAKHYSRSHEAVIRVYDAAGNVIDTHERKSDSVDSALPWRVDAANHAKFVFDFDPRFYPQSI
jgi:hypothetical protein